MTLEFYSIFKCRTSPITSNSVEKHSLPINTYKDSTRLQLMDSSQRTESQERSPPPSTDHTSIKPLGSSATSPAKIASYNWKIPLYRGLTTIASNRSRRWEIQVTWRWSVQDSWWESVTWITHPIYRGHHLSMFVSACSHPAKWWQLSPTAKH